MVLQGGKPAPGAPVLPVVAWDAAWLEPWRDRGQTVAAAVAQGMPVWQALNQHLQAPVAFCAHDELPAGVPYEHYIAQTGRCPTRDGLHDLFNGLCWDRFPATKRRLNALQAAQIGATGIRSTRGAVRDALTVFDENAALLQAPDPLWDALAAKHWQALFGSLRPLWSQARLVLFGHALLEKLVTPRKPITAHVLRMRVPPDSPLDDWDQWLAAELDADRLAAKPFAHLPVLGVPGWWAANEDPAFHADPEVFRPPRARASQAQ